MRVPVVVLVVHLALRHRGRAQTSSTGSSSGKTPSFLAVALMIVFVLIAHVAIVVASLVLVAVKKAEDPVALVVTIFLVFTLLFMLQFLLLSFLFSLLRLGLVVLVQLVIRDNTSSTYCGGVSAEAGALTRRPNTAAAASGNSASNQGGISPVVM